MKISNENEVAAYHVIRIALASLFAGYVVSFWLFAEYFSWSGNEVVRIIGHVYASIYVIVSAYVWLKGGIWFVEFSFKDDVYEFRYYILTAPFGAKRMVRIPAENLYAYFLESTFLKLKRRLILFQERDGKIFQYPPIPIGSLMKEKQVQVIGELDKYGIKLSHKEDVGR